MTVDSARAFGRCSRCGAEFHCGIADAGGCWCARLPPLPANAVQARQGCLCERCLRAALLRAGVAVAAPN